MHDKFEIYLITHSKSGLLYVGMAKNDARIRFTEHMLGYGAISIADMLKGGADPSEFSMEVIGNATSCKEAKELESYFVNLYETAYPKGLNVERATSTFKKFSVEFEKYIKSGWCVSLLNQLVHNRWKPAKESNMQNMIELLARNQSTESMLTCNEVARMNAKFRQKYSLMETIRVNGEGFRNGREKYKQRVQNKQFTEAELLAIKSRSSLIKSAWKSKTEEERLLQYSKGLDSMNCVKIECEYCGRFFTVANMSRHYKKCKNENHKD